MAKNLKVGTDVYQVRQWSSGPLIYHGYVTELLLASQVRVEWLHPQYAALCGTTTREYACELHRTPQRAVTAYLKRVKNNLLIQADTLLLG